jgi:hypothetical protein
MDPTQLQEYLKYMVVGLRLAAKPSLSRFKLDLFRAIASIDIMTAHDIQAKANPKLSESLANLLKSYVKEAIPSIDFNYDALASGIRGMSPGAISFPARPKIFDEANLNGTILVKGIIDPPISEWPIYNRRTQLFLSAGFYFKTPKLPGGGKYNSETAEQAGTLDIEFDESGLPIIMNEPIVSELITVIQSVAEKTVANPPEGAKSLTRDPQERKRLKEQAETAEQYSREQTREKEQRQQQKELQEANQATHGSPEIFKQYMSDQEEEEFGPRDLDKVLNTMYDNKNDRLLMRNEVNKKIQSLGLKWNPGKTRESSWSPEK